MDNIILSDNKIPLKKEQLLNGAKKAINCLAWDKSGARILTGCSDHIVRMYDFGGMTSEHEPFHEFSVAEGQSVYSLNYNITSDKFIASTADAKPVVYDKNGNKIVRFIKGDPYVLDNSKTPGHTNTVTATCWHPTNESLVLSTSLDGTCRIWDLFGRRSFDELQSLQVIRAKNKKGLKIGITSGSYNSTGNQIMLGCSDGGLLLYDTRNKFSRAISSNFTTHSDQIIHIQSHKSGQLFTTRGKDDIVCIWDIRNLNKPIKKYSNITTYGNGCNVVFSPDNEIMVLAVPSPQGVEEVSTLRFYKVFEPTLKPLYTHSFLKTESPSSVVWHPVLNQIIVGMRDGGVKILYDPDMSVRGACLIEGRTNVKKKEMTFGRIDSLIYAPEGNNDDIRDNRDDPKKRENRPGFLDPFAAPYREILHSGSAKGWNENMAAIPEAGLPSFSMSAGPNDKSRAVNPEVDMDPRQALLNYESNKKKDKEADYFANVFKKNMPTPIYSKRTLEADLDDEAERIKKRVTLNH